VPDDSRKTTAKLKTSGGEQFVLLPAGFRLGMRDVEIVREGNEVILRAIPVRKGDYRRGSKRLVVRDGLRAVE
jgi:virulence-associated protein VagC